MRKPGRLGRGFDERGGLRRRLMQLRRNRRELGVQLGTKPVHNGDDGECYARGDQAILNRGGPGFVFEKRPERPHKLSIADTSKISVNEPYRLFCTTCFKGIIAQFSCWATTALH